MEEDLQEDLEEEDLEEDLEEEDLQEEFLTPLSRLSTREERAAAGGA